ncbi:tetratricopeptide repeat protein [Flavobacterium sp. GCM10023249]|uniref:tetratricopeptide repeat protein n=1 Tax=unclassified Flavobacterium TaxID=196869 RepID=UPI00361AB2B8
MKNFNIFLVLFSQIIVAQTNFEKAEKLFQQKQFDQAKPLLENEYKNKPNDAKVVEYLGDIAGHQKQWDNALFYYTKLRDKNPKSANYQFKYGGALGMKAKNSNKFKALGMIDDVKEAFETAAKLDSKHIECRWALVVLYIELPGIIGGSESKAQKYANELLTLSKVDGYLAKGYIDVYFKRFDKAEVNYKKAHEIGHSKITFEKLYDLYLNKLKNKEKAQKLKTDFS